MKKLNITFCSYPDYSGNAKALYEYMIKRYNNNMNYTWIVYNQKTVDRLHKLGIKSILIGTDEFKKYIPKTNVFFTTQGNLDGDKIKVKNSIYVELWHGIGPKPSGFAQKNPSDEDIIGYGNISEIVDYFIVPSVFWNVIHGAIFKAEYNRFKDFGMPILDYFVNSNGKENLSKLIHRNLEDYEKIIMYMPTFKKGFNHNDIKNISNNIFDFKEKYNEEELNQFLKENKYLLCIKKHPGEMANLKFKNMSNIVNITEKMLEDSNLSVNEIINAFNLMITDYSSIGTEFIFLDRPVLFTAGNIDEYIENRGIHFDNYDFWTPGPVCKDFVALKNEMKKILTDNSYFLEERKKYKKLWFGDTKDGGCDKICDFLFTSDYKISDKVVRYKSDFSLLKHQNKKLIEINKNQNKKIIELKKSDEQLQKILHSRSYKIVQKINSIRKKAMMKK